MSSRESSPTDTYKMPISEEEMLSVLRDKFVIVPKGVTTPSKLGAKPRTSQAGDDLLTPKKTIVHSSQSYPPFIPKLPLFSGHDPIPKGEVSYTEWRYEVRCVLSDHDLPSSHILQIVRSSLRGTARRLMIPSGEDLTVDLLLQKLDSVFSDLSPKKCNYAGVLCSTETRGKCD